MNPKIILHQFARFIDVVHYVNALKTLYFTMNGQMYCNIRQSIALKNKQKPLENLIQFSNFLSFILICRKLNLTTGVM